MGLQEHAKISGENNKLKMTGCAKMCMLHQDIQALVTLKRYAQQNISICSKATFKSGPFGRRQRNHVENRPERQTIFDFNNFNNINNTFHLSILTYSMPTQGSGLAFCVGQSNVDRLVDLNPCQMRAETSILPSKTTQMRVSKQRICLPSARSVSP